MTQLTLMYECNGHLRFLSLGLLLQIDFISASPAGHTYPRVLKMTFILQYNDAL